MAKTLIIKNADFEQNALDVVVFDSIPCTAISLDKQAAEVLSIGGTSTITPTLTPANTTDQVVWETSDSNVATVVNGVVTTVGVGLTTITATCGEQTASCVVTSRAFMDTENVLKIPEYYPAGVSDQDGGNGLPYIDANARTGMWASSSGRLKFEPFGSSPTCYPYELPKNTAKIEVTIPEGSTISEAHNIMWFNAETKAANRNDVVKMIRRAMDFVKSGSVYSANVPSIEGYPEINAFAFGLRLPSGNTLTSETMNGVVIEFLPAE